MNECYVCKDRRGDPSPCACKDLYVCKRCFAQLPRTCTVCLHPYPPKRSCMPDWVYFAIVMALLLLLACVLGSFIYALAHPNQQITPVFFVYGFAALLALVLLIFACVRACKRQQQLHPISTG